MFQRLEPIERVERTHVIWQALAWPGFEHLCLEEWSTGGGYTVDGLITAVLSDHPSRVWYRIELDDDWTFRSLNLVVTDEISEFDDGPLDLGGERLELVHTVDGRWDHDREDQSVDLDKCVDIDIAVTPFTNTLPIRRLDLDVGESTEITVAYITVPQLKLSPAAQRYTRLGRRSYRFESLESGFVANITVDDRGLVDDYPGLFRRVWPD